MAIIKTQRVASLPVATCNEDRQALIGSQVLRVHVPRHFNRSQVRQQMAERMLGLRPILANAGPLESDVLGGAFQYFCCFLNPLLRLRQRFAKIVLWNDPEVVKRGRHRISSAV
jgi:hypothetical protein